MTIETAQEAQARVEKALADWIEIDPIGARTFVRRQNFELKVTREEFVAVKDRRDAACLAVVRDRIASDGYALSDKLQKAIACELFVDLGLPWNSDRYVSATPLEIAAHEVIQESIRLSEHGYYGPDFHL